MDGASPNERVSDYLRRIGPELDRFLLAEHGDAVERYDEWSAALSGPLPEEGVGAYAVLEELERDVLPNGMRLAEPGWWGFITVAPDGLPTAVSAAASIAGPQRYTITAFNRLEELSLEWLAQLCGLDSSMKGVYSSGGSVANLVALGAARQWAFERIGIDPPTYLEGSFTDADVRISIDSMGIPYADFAVELSAPARGVVVWSILRQLGREGMRARVRRDNDFARYLAARVRDSEALELLGEPALSICCFRYVGEGIEDLDGFNAALFRRPVQETPYLPSSTVVNGQFAIRPCFINPRTEREHVDGLVDAVVAIGDELRVGATMA